LDLSQYIVILEILVKLTSLFWGGEIRYLVDEITCWKVTGVLHLTKNSDWPGSGQMYILKLVNSEERIFYKALSSCWRHRVGSGDTVAWRRESWVRTQLYHLVEMVWWTF
jgi:hypothetical protein